MSMQMMNRVSNKAAGSLPARPARLAVRVSAEARPSAKSINIASSAVLLAALAQASPALAEPVPTPVPSTISGDVDAAIYQVISFVKGASSFIKSSAKAISAGVDTLKEGYATAEPYLKKGYSTVEPFFQQAADATSSIVRPVITAATPVIQESYTDAVAATGIEVDDVLVPVTQATQAAVTAVSPVLSSAWAFLSSSSPVALGEYGIGLFALYLAAPSLLGALAGGLRGYAGDLSASASVDLLINGSAVLVDLRSLKEKESSGIPDLPNSVRDRVQEVEFALTEDRKLRGSLRDPNSIEVQVTALRVSALKRVNKNTTILLLDRYGSNAVAVAKELAAKGYSKAYVISGGFDGRSGWVQSKLQIKPAAVTEGTSFSIGTRGVRRALAAPR